ncbi:unannotated protein [freshwater metagenome]|uniref:Unannotated protein n=1 Tax=freshwater metagenome TaxID=449393 RepID=A0A6J6T8W8_9ZZZZ|nr:DUF222 domain-containing protein [Actinomycetota bacterium]
MEALGQHVVDRGVAVAGAALAELGEASLLGLDQATVADSLVALSALEAQVAELKHRVVAHAAEVRVEEPTGATTTATWLAHATRTTRRAARRAVHLAEALGRFAVLRGAMAAGWVNLEQATVVVRALEDLPSDLPTWVVAEAERTLVELAAAHDADDLRVLGDRVLALVAPEVGEAHEAAQLAAAEKDAERATKLTLTPDGSGRVHGRFVVPELHAAMLRKMLMALVVHDRPAPAADEPEADCPDGAVLRGEPQRRTTADELGRAFCELLERLDGREAPKVGGTGATVVVTMTLETLQGGLASAVLDTGDRVAAHTARRLACEAGIVPVVLGGKGQVLDQGRKQRFFTTAQVIALGARDGGCTAEGCRTAAWFCHAHHDDPWSTGGRTDLARGRLLCPSHHRRVHDPAYEHRVTGDNRVVFTRRT